MIFHAHKRLTAWLGMFAMCLIVCVPLVSRDANQKALGVIQLDTLDRFKKFSQDDLKLLLSVAGQSAVALDNARMHESLLLRIGLERDLQTARQVQHSFLPKSMPKLVPARRLLFLLNLLCRLDRFTRIGNDARHDADYEQRNPNERINWDVTHALSARLLRIFGRLRAFRR